VSGYIAGVPSEVRRALLDLERKVTEVEGVPGPEGPVGPAGPTGATGATGATGPAGVDGTLGVVAESRVTANSASFTAATTLTSVTHSFTTARKYKITVHGGVSSDTTGTAALVALREGATQVQRAIFIPSVINTAESYTITWTNNTNLSGSITFNVVASRLSGGGNLVSAAASTHPLLLIVEDVGPL
jgi:hypothetical protein